MAERVRWARSEVFRVALDVHEPQARRRKAESCAALYARKSTEQKNGDAVLASTTRQIETSTASAMAHGYVVTPEHVYEEKAISGAEFERRPELMRLLAALKPRPPFAALFVYDGDRLGREQIETSYLIKQLVQAGVRVFETKVGGREITLDSPVDKVILSVTAFASDIEREQARVRTRAAMVARAKAGYVTGGEIYGYDRVEVRSPDGHKRLHVERALNQGQALIATRVFDRVSQGAGFRRISHELNADGGPTVPGL
jgi:DNA invertase Pin-like site-specific DNA recombinase